jgi:hypothetical protein
MARFGHTLSFVPVALTALACQLAADLADRAVDQFLPDAGSPPQDTSPATTSTPRSLPPELPPADASPVPPEAETIPPEVRRQMDQIQEEVVQIRGLQATGPVARALLSADDLRRHVIDDFLADYTAEEAADDVRTLALLGLLDPGYDLFQLYLDLYSEQVTGFYDKELKQLYVVQGEAFRGPERLTHAHEYTHALQDQHYDLRNGLGFNDEACELDSERCAAVQALIEGDATLTETQWLTTFGSEQDYQELLEFYGELESPVFDSAPRFLQDDFIFPYTSGLEFVESFFQEGGFAAVDAAYADPPLSTEQILHPERYPDDRPIRLEPAELLERLGGDWRELDRDVLGEWYTQLTLREQILEEQAALAAEGWGGDYFLAFYHDDQDQGALILLSVWDNLADAHEFFGFFLQYADGRFGSRSSSSTTQVTWDSALGYASVELQGDQTLWVLAPDRSLAESLRGGIDFPARPLP